MRILVVKDDVLLSAALAKTLKPHRHTPDRAKNGQAALEITTANQQTAVLNTQQQHW